MPVSYAEYSGDGSTTTFSVPFPYILKNHVKLFYGRDRLAGTQTSTLVDGTDFSWTSGTQVQITTAPASGVTLTIERQTPGDNQLVAWSDGSNLTAEALNNADLQNLYVVQEQTDSNSVGATKAIAAETAATAATTAATASTTAANAATSSAATATSTAAASTTASNAATAAANTATTRVETYVHDGTNLKGDGIGGNPQGLAYAVTQSSSANTTAATANTNATTALNNSRESDGSGGYTSAISIANTAKTTADSASATATSASSTASTASTNATTALNNSRTSDGSGGYDSAISIAQNAQTVANNASTAVSNAVLFTIINNVASIPGSPSDGDYIEVTNSTGIESFTPLASLPAGFAGDSGLTVRLNYTTSGSTWNYMSYFANDPEDRYIGPAGGTITNQRNLLFGEATANGSNTVGFKAPASVASNVIWVLPAADATSDGQAIVSDGSGNLSFGDVAQPTIDGGNFATGGSLVSSSQTFDGKSFD